MDFPNEIKLELKKIEKTRYGENPQQDGALYESLSDEKLDKILPITRAKQLHGKQMSFNNWLDADGVLKMLWQFEQPFSTVFKHINPSGACQDKNLLHAAKGAWNGDPLSAFGSIWGFNRPVTKEVAEYMVDGKFLEGVVAPKYEDDALETLKRKKKLRILEIDTKVPEDPGYDLRQIHGGFLAQEFDYAELTPEDLIYLEDKGIERPTEKQIEDMLFGWKINRRTKSNTVLLVKNKKTIGIGAGQQNRVDAGFIAGYRANKPYEELKNPDREIENLNILHDKRTREIGRSIESPELKAHYEKIINRLKDLSNTHYLARLAGLNTRGRSEGSVAVSSAFYPFPDTIEVLHAFGVEGSLSPAGSIRDEASYEALRRKGMSAAHTPPVEKGGYKGGVRAFLH